jgi:hypothetical protein
VAESAVATVNNKVYIHEFIDITKQNRARYMQHITANWSPIAQVERNQLCYGVFGTIGSTGAWPQVVNIWEENGFDGLARNFGHETGGFGMQDPALAKWWAGAADLRSGGFDRVLIPHPQTKTITELCAARMSTVATYAHELVRLDRGRPEAFLDAAIDAAPAVGDRFGWQLLGAWRTAMVADDECVLLWAIPSWEAWGAAEQALLTEPELLVGGAEKEVRSRHRVLLVDAPLSPLRTGRQPARSDRTDWKD